jgi:hypothetical protein
VKHIRFQKCIFKKCWIPHYIFNLHINTYIHTYSYTYLFVLVFLETDSYSRAQTGLKHRILLPQPPTYCQIIFWSIFGCIGLNKLLKWISPHSFFSYCATRRFQINHVARFPFSHMHLYLQSKCSTTNHTPASHFIAIGWSCPKLCFCGIIVNDNSTSYLFRCFHWHSAGTSSPCTF